MGKNFAAIDCGTNTTRLLLARKEGKLTELDRRLVITRLGQGTDYTGELAPEALQRTFAALDDYAAQIEEAGGAQIRVVATSAVRDAGNSREFFDGVRQRLGVDPDVITGEEEARLSYRGAVQGLPKLAGPVLVMDIGGGSTELTIGNGDQIEKPVSLDIGSVRVRERFLQGDPPTKAERASARAYIDALIDGSGLDFSDVYSFVGVGGTVTSLSAINQDLAEYDREQVHDSVISTDELRTLNSRLLHTPIEQIAKIPTMEEGRADVIAAGCLIAREVARFVGLPLRVSEEDLLDAIIADMAK
ncbi:MAG: Ppx/GppA family phosphatase [Propionibacteriaceae bacterium]|jgi:exopolyphosphatase/guanosine-5'-triphosphate,3'-diphosphate pyrophosphatase|nr:Ppx/GppA family phosphatase [Propionibacteriaceae bacterium]